MRRREFLTIAGGSAAAWPLAATANAESSRATRRIGIVVFGAADLTNSTLAVLKPAWLKLGYVEGDTVLLRGAGRVTERFPPLIAELIGLDVGVLIAIGNRSVKAAVEASATIPIVAIDLETDPVRAGYAASIARPGGNVTGLFMNMASLAEKWVELLREAAPEIVRIGIVWDPTTGPDQLKVAQAAARSKGIDVTVIEASQTDSYEIVFRNLGRPRQTGIIQLAAPVSNQAAKIAEAAHRYQLPTMTFLSSYAKANGTLLSYGPNQADYFPRAMMLADLILKGTKASELPIEQPTKFELFVNLKTAKALGLAMPTSILLRADEVIE